LEDVVIEKLVEKEGSGLWGKLMRKRRVVGTISVTSVPHRMEKER
jgi:hypothetical protein